MNPIDFTPVSGFDLPRFAGIPTFMRLPHVALDDPAIEQVDVGLIGTPWDSGTTNRAGARHGPRQLRDLSTMIRAEHGVSGVRPFERRRCADLGDVSPNPIDIEDGLERIRAFYARVKDANVRPLTAGGDHLCSLPILRALAADAPLGMIHFDSHTDLFDSYFDGNRYTHGTPFRRAVEEGLLDPRRVTQIGIRGTAYDRQDRHFADSVGIRIVPIEELFARGVDDVMTEARERAGGGRTYVSYDIDFVDPTFAPGTGTPEVGGPSSFQALQVAPRSPTVSRFYALRVRSTPRAEGVHVADAATGCRGRPRRGVARQGRRFLAARRRGRRCQGAQEARTSLSLHQPPGAGREAPLADPER